MNKNTKSTSRTKKAPAKATKTTKTRATKTAAKTTKSKTTKSAPQNARTKPRATKTRATKTRTRMAKESSPPEELPHDKTPEPSDNKSSDNETYESPERLSGLSTDSILDMAAMLRREAQLEKLRQYYYSHKDKICEDQNSKYPTRREDRHAEIITIRIKIRSCQR